MPAEKVFDPFSSKSVLDLGDLSSTQTDAWDQLKLDTDTEYLRLSEVERPSLTDLRADLLKLHIEDAGLQNLELEDDVVASATSPSSNGGSSRAGTPAELDIWNINELSSKVIQEGLLTWDAFSNAATKSSDRKYVTETTTREYNNLQTRLCQSGQKKSLQFADGLSLQKALTNLIFGRSSSFFVWNEKVSHFDFNVPEFAISGCTQAVSARICKHFMSFGSRYRRLKDYSQATTGANSTKYAFQRSLQKALHSLELHASSSQEQQPRCILILEEVKKMIDLLSALEYIFKTTASSLSEPDFLTTFAREIENVWASYCHLRPILNIVLSDVAQPAIQQTRQLLGLQQDVTIRANEDEWLFVHLLPQYHQALTDVKACLAVLGGFSSKATSVETAHNINLAHSWSDLVGIQNNADVVENATRIDRSSQLPVLYGHAANFHEGAEALACPDPFSIDFDFVAPNAFGAAQIEQERTLRPPMSREIAHMFSDTATEVVAQLSPLQAIKLSLGPIIGVSRRLTSFAVVKTLFVQHELKAHLHVLAASFLIGSGLFTTRLATALFDSSQDNLEGKRKSGLTGGLRLEDREVWPPASSELRLVLNGILFETISSTIPVQIRNCVSFAIKELSDEEAELCRNAQSIHALDFLRIVYAPSDAMLESVITPGTLDKYDRIFNFMLILLRVHTLCQSLTMRIVKAQSPPHDNIYIRFCLEANHFVRTLLDYATNNAIFLPWREFEQRVQIISDCVMADDYQRTVNEAKSISQLCQDHADTLDNILKGLLLKKRHAEALGMIREIFDLILRFGSDAKQTASASRIKAAYSTFRRLRESWYHAVEDICRSARDPAFQRLKMLLIQIDLSGTLGLSGQM